MVQRGEYGMNEYVVTPQTKVLSPITCTDHTRKEREIDTKSIVDGYARLFNFDVSSYFLGLTNITLYCCLDTGYRFFHPFGISGDGKYYERMQEEQNYYVPWKWEHERARELVRPGDRILEIGCGEGGFLQGIKQTASVECVGLELNVKASDIGRTTGLSIYNKTIEEYSQDERDGFDIVCCFQVLEHICDVRSFIQASLSVLKNKGRLIVSVPNNDSYIKDMKGSLYNMPPHHMGLWNERSLRALAGVFPLSVENIWTEPLQPYHYSSKLATSLQMFLTEGGLPYRALFRVFNPLSGLIFGPIRRWIRGHSIVGSFIIIK
jgi:2-polyprenyl-3-methyl-5-hydroxy-6-metoxy-1,4-benzoquinol methylase